MNLLPWEDGRRDIFISFSNLDPLIKKLEELAKLPDGWHYGEGVSPSGMAIEIAKSIYENVRVLSIQADVFPGTDGSLSIVFYEGDSCIEILISASGELDLTKEVGKGSEFEEIEDQQSITFEYAIRRVADLYVTSHPWILYDWFTQGTGIKSQAGFEARASRALVMEPASPFWTSVVLRSEVYQFALTFSNSMLLLLGTQSSSGTFQPAHYQIR